MLVATTIQAVQLNFFGVPLAYQFVNYKMVFNYFVFCELQINNIGFFIQITHYYFNNMEIEWLSTKKVSSVLIFLYDRDKATFGEIHSFTKGNYSTLNKALNLLKELSLISEKREPNVDESGRIVVGETRWIWLTPKGRKIAEKLLEIKEILEKE